MNIQALMQLLSQSPPPDQGGLQHALGGSPPPAPPPPRPTPSPGPAIRPPLLPPAAPPPDAAATRQAQAVAAARGMQPRLRGPAFQGASPQMAQGLAALMQAMPRPQQVRAPPPIAMPSAQDVQQAAGAMGDPQAAAARLMSRGGPAAQPDFLSRPDGEEQLEDFAFRRMVSEGDNAPRAMQEAWLGIQRSKQQRLAQRADYAASLIKLRRNADNQLASQSLAGFIGNQRIAAQNIMNLRLKQAEMQFNADRQNVAAANQFGAEQRNAVRAFAAAGMKRAQGPNVKDRVALEKEFVNPAANAWAAAQSGRRFFKSSLEIANRLGLGVAGRGIQAVMAAAGGGAAREFQQNWYQLRQNLVTTYASEAGARAIDTPPELRALVAVIPDEGSNPDVIARWVTRWVKESTKTVQQKLNAVNDQFPGYGDIILKDITDGDEVQALTIDAMRNLAETAPR